MRRKLKAIVPIILGAIWWFLTNVVESWFFDRVLKLEPKVSGMLPYLVEYLPLVAFFILAIWIGFGQNIRVWLNEFKEPAFRVSAGSPLAEPRVSFVWLVSEIQKTGLNFDDKYLGIIDISNRLRQAGVDGTLTFWGRPRRLESGQLIRGEPLSKIPMDHWKDFQINWPGAFKIDFMGGTKISGIEEDNFPVATYSFTAPDNKHAGYADLHIDRSEAQIWLKHQTARIKSAQYANANL